jgi:hypothetical protein
MIALLTIMSAHGMARQQMFAKLARHARWLAANVKQLNHRPARQVIFTQRSLSTRYLAQVRGQMRPALAFTASKASALAVFTSSFMLACSRGCGWQ